MAVVLITGCRSGIGLQTALAFARRGDRVYATSRDVVRADQLRQSVDRILAAVDDPASPTRVLVGDDAIAAFDAHRRALLAAWHAELAADSDAE